MNVEQIVGENIRRIREKRGFSQESLALEAEMSRPYIGEVERAEKSLTINRLAKIAKVLGVSPSLLVTKEGYKSIS